MKKSYSIILSILVIGIVFSSFLVLAEQETPNVEGGFNFRNWINHQLGTQFSVVGDSRQCAVNPSQEKTVAYHGTIHAGSTYCQNYLVDLFDTKWNAIGEYKNFPTQICGDVDGCIAQYYCCPHPECSSTTDCTLWSGAGSQCLSKSSSDPGIVYQDGSTFKYCSSPSQVQSICYYYSGEGDSCSSRTYIGEASCPQEYMGKILYPLKSTCEAYINSGDDTGEQVTCSSKGGVCKSTSGGADEIFRQDGKTKFDDCTTLQGCFCSEGTEKCEDNICKLDCTSEVTMGKSLSDVQKISLTEEEVSQATTNELIGSVCYKSNECLSRVGYNSQSCVRLSSLKDKGILTEADDKAFFDKANTVFISTVGGGILGAGGGVLACASGVFAGGAIIVASGGAAAPAVVPIAGTACATLIGAGALIGAGTGLVLSDVALTIDKKDPLVKAINAKDESSVGLCVAKNQSGLDSYLGWAGFFDITGDGQKNGIDGLILIGGIVLLSFVVFKK